MKNRILIDSIAHRARAEAADIDSLASEPLWFGMMFRDEDGRVWVPAPRENLFYGALGSQADIRRNACIQAADEELLACYANLNRMRRRPSTGIRGAAHWQQQMLGNSLRVLDALVQLVDAKLDARRMAPEAAEAIKTDVAGLRRDVEQNADGALKAIRSLLDVAA